MKRTSFVQFQRHVEEPTTPRSARSVWMGLSGKFGLAAVAAISINTVGCGDDCESVLGFCAPGGAGPGYKDVGVEGKSHILGDVFYTVTKIDKDNRKVNVEIRALSTYSCPDSDGKVLAKGTYVEGAGALTLPVEDQYGLRLYRFNAEFAPDGRLVAHYLFIDCSDSAASQES